MLRITLTGAAAAFAMPALIPAALAQQAGPQGAEPQQQPAAGSQVAAIVESEFPVYDADGSGALEQGEFSRWLITLKQKELETTGQTAPQAELEAWATASFQAADADKSGAVTKEELIAYLSAGR